MSSQKNKDLDRQIKKAVADVKRKEKLRIHLDHLKELLREELAKEKSLTGILHKEKREFERIDQPGIRRMFQKILGNIESAVEKERQDYILAYLKHERCLKAIKQLQKEQTILKVAYSKLHLAEKKLDQLLERKKIAAPLHDPNLKKKLDDINLNIFTAFAQIREIKEAIAAGKKANKQMGHILDDLRNVKAWGVIHYHGAGSKSSTQKKKYIDKATGDVYKADALLLKFQEELHDISKHYQVDYHNEIHQLQDFLHQFFHNLIVDWVLKNKIVNTILGTKNLIDTIDVIILTLEGEIDKTQKYILQQKRLQKELMM